MSAKQPTIDAGTRRKLRIKLGGRVGRRSGTKSNKVPSHKRVKKPKVRLAQAIRDYLAEQKQETLQAA